MRHALGLLALSLMPVACGGPQGSLATEQSSCQVTDRVIVELDAVSTEVVLAHGDASHAWLGVTTPEGARIIGLRLDHLGDRGLERVGTTYALEGADWRVAAVDEDDGSLLVGLRTRHGNAARVRAVFLGAVGDLGLGASLGAAPDARVELDVGFRDGVPVALMGTNGATLARLLVSTSAIELELPGTLLGPPEWKPELGVFFVTVVEHGVERWLHIKPDGTVERVDRRHGIGLLLNCGGDDWTPVASLTGTRPSLVACTRTDVEGIRVRVVQSRCSIHDHDAI